ncbi:Demethylmenaquinone methyltransferase [Roseivivax jejudonensis]|uniref:Demethylmenaquinone methyltransferase n=1 Tax=Roseivivax jejudonensis TaxID=1529041 RepID=A0A1X7A1E6_9RHOB|nr:methyltransferase domain-containing protein [Roseivivax jejudonensis]SLN67895.1 Demethylmenaquinone methyltransferase [Roseivivax jejudonensis]
MTETTTAPPPAAEMWGLGGAHYDLVSFAIGDALAHAAQRLAPPPGARVLDVATGTGWTARNVARFGAHVDAVDFSPGMLDAARALSSHIKEITFAVADAQALPFETATFDGVISTFGVMFAPDHRQAAAELTRVCRPGGRLVLATWAPGGSVEEFFGVIGRHGDAAPPEPSPMLWGDPDHVDGLLGDAFELTFEQGTSHAYHETVAAIRDWYARGFGPVRAMAASLDPARRAVLWSDIDAFHDRYVTEAGLHVKRDYLITIGTRR